MRSQCPTTIRGYFVLRGSFLSQVRNSAAARCLGELMFRCGVASLERACSLEWIGFKRARGEGNSVGRAWSGHMHSHRQAAAGRPLVATLTNQTAHFPQKNVQ